MTEKSKIKEMIKEHWSDPEFRKHYFEAVNEMYEEFELRKRGLNNVVDHKDELIDKLIIERDELKSKVNKLTFQYGTMKRIYNNRWKYYDGVEE